MEQIAYLIRTGRWRDVDKNFVNLRPVIDHIARNFSPVVGDKHFLTCPELEALFWKKIL